MKSVRIFKLTTGEMVIARVLAVEGTPFADLSEDQQDSLSLVNAESFDVTNPAVIALQQNMQLALIPMMPWSNPKDAPSMDFSGFAICGEVDVRNDTHKAFIGNYYQSVTGIELTPPGGANIVLGDFPKR